MPGPTTTGVVATATDTPPRHGTWSIGTWGCSTTASRPVSSTTLRGATRTSALRSRFPSLLDTLGTCDACQVLTEHSMQIAPSSYYAHLRWPVTDAHRSEA